MDIEKIREVLQDFRRNKESKELFKDVISKDPKLVAYFTVVAKNWRMWSRMAYEYTGDDYEFARYLGKMSNEAWFLAFNFKEEHCVRVNEKQRLEFLRDGH